MTLLLGALVSSCDSSSPSDAEARSDASDADAATEEHPDAADEHDASDGNDASADHDASDSGGDPRGVYAVKTVIDAWWQDEVDPPLVDRGRGVITLFHKVDVAKACGDDAIEPLELEPCGVVFPPLVSWASCSAYQLEALESSSSSAEPVSVELGRLDETYRDTGCGLDAENPVTFRGMPTSANVLALCDPPGDADCALAVELTARLEASLTVDASLDACAMRQSQLTEALRTAEIALDVDACELDDGSACSSLQADYVDALVPSYRLLEPGAAPPPTAHANPCECASGCTGDACPLDQTPSLGTRSALVWLDEANADLDCEAVRAAAYPDL